MATTTGPTAGEERLHRAIDAASTAVAEALAGVTWQTQDVTVLEAVRRVAVLRAQVDALHLALVRQVDERGVATASPVATTPEGFLRTACLLDAGQARRDVAAARATAPDAPLEPFADMLADGRTSRAHLDVAVTCLDDIPTHVLARPGAPARMVEHLQEAADGTGPAGMKKEAARLLSRLVPEREERFDVHAHQRRFLDLHTDDTGMVVGSFQLDAVTGASLRTALDQHGAPTVGADGDPDRRTARQRRADALGSVCETALGVAVPRRGERPRIVVHVTPAQLVGASAGLAYLESGDPLSHAETTRLACDAVLQRVVMDPSAGPLDVGRTHRLVTLAQRRALEARDGGCIIPGCGAKATFCDAHHVVPWVDGGPTDLGNLGLLCPGHHTAVHAGSWWITVEDGQLMVTPPRWVDPTRTPRPVQHHRVRRTVDGLDLDLDLAAGPVDDLAQGPTDDFDAGVVPDTVTSLVPDTDTDTDRVPDSYTDRVPDTHTSRVPDTDRWSDPGDEPGPHPATGPPRWPHPDLDLHVPAGRWSPTSPPTWPSDDGPPAGQDAPHRHVDLTVGPLVQLMQTLLREHASAPP